MLIIQLFAFLLPPQFSMETRAATRIPLKWEERDGYQWWFATPLDWAASNGYVEVVIELLKLEPSLMKDLASLTRIRRLEDLWDDEGHFTDAAKGRGLVARELILQEWHINPHSLIDAGYGPWALYTAAGAGDMEIVQRLLKRKPQLVFGDREYGLMDMLYAAARSKSSEIFREILHYVKDDYHAQSFRSNTNHIEYCRGMGIDLPFEVMNKALHAASRGGSLEILRELVRQPSHHRLNVVIWCKDNRGGTALHSAASRGHVEVVKELLSTSPGAITSEDDNGNTALHVAAYNGHWGVVKELLRRLPPLFYSINNDGNTLFHLVVGGFRACGFRCPHRHMEFIRNLFSDRTLNLQSIVNGQNGDGRTALHIAVISGRSTDEKLVKLLMSAPGLDINIYDKNGMTAYDLVKATVASGLASMSLLQDLAEAGGRPTIPQSPAAESPLFRSAADDTEIIRLWEQSEDDADIYTEVCEIVEAYSNKTCELANSKNNVPGNQMNKYPAKQRRGTFSEMFQGLKVKAHRSRTEDAGMRNSKENRVNAYVQEVAGFSQRIGHTKPLSPLTEQYFSATSVAGDDYYSVFSLSPSPSISFPTPSPLASPPVSGLLNFKAKGWFHINGDGDGDGDGNGNGNGNGNDAQAVDDSKPALSLRNQYLNHGGVANSEHQKTNSRPPLHSRRAG